MKISDSVKVYQRLTFKERAALAIEHASCLNENERDQIIDSLPSKSYLCHDPEFYDWQNAFFTLSLFWGMETWKLRTKLVIVLPRYYQESKSMETEAQAYNELIRIQSMLLALDEALKAVCEEHGLNPEVVYRFVDVMPFEAWFEGVEADIFFIEEMKSYLQLVLG